MSDGEEASPPDSVKYVVHEQSLEDYRRAAQLINAGGYVALLVQHEYGIFGGEAGAHLLSLLRRVELPIVTTLHTVLEDPSPAERAVLIEVVALSARVVVMSTTAIRFLREVYGVDTEKVDLIPHGAPPIEHGDRAAGIELMGEGAPLILTFGFLSPDKGIQHCIRAMPGILDRCPNARYVVVGQTHPNVLKSRGDAYRQSLMDLVGELGLEDRVKFVNRFVSDDEVVDCLAAMDYYVTPYLNPRQITSGTLAYAIGAGKAVLSTPYWYAKELLADGRGVLVPFGDHDAIAEAILTLEGDRSATDEMGRKAAAYGAGMQWPTVGERYLETIDRACDNSLSEFMKPGFIEQTNLPGVGLPSLDLTHLYTLSDDTGIFQHARFGLPCRDEGYCLDDNARALLLTLEIERKGPLDPTLSMSQSRYLSFVLGAYDHDSERFRNFMSFERAWLEVRGSEDSHGRAVWALGTCAELSRIEARRRAAADLLHRAASRLLQTTSPRTWAYGMLGLSAAMRSDATKPEMREVMLELGERLVRQFDLVSSPDWQWFESSLTYANARLSQALIEAGLALGERRMTDVGLESLEWLMHVQADELGRFMPIGSNGFYTQGDVRASYDQQPIEAWASASACISAGRAEADPVWRARADVAFAWFHGHNTLDLPLMDEATGGCRDGIHADRLNENQGAEATLSYLCSLCEITHSRDAELATAKRAR